MKVSGRIKSVKRYLGHLLKDDEEFYLFVNKNSVSEEKLKKIGFSKKFESGEQVIPYGFGKITDFNVNGKEVIKIPKEYETKYYEREWTRKEFRGRNNTVEVTSWIDIPYKKLKRTYIYPMEKTFTISNDQIISEKLIYNEENFEIILHYLRMFGEIFKQCDVLNSNFESILSFEKVKKLDWEMLPESEQINWETVSKELKENRTKSNDRKIIDRRINFFKNYKEDFAAIGTGGFKGYIVLGYPQKNLYICECFYHGNATYILGENWKTITKLTKKEIIDGSMSKERVIHDKNWEANLKKYFK